MIKSVEHELEKKPKSNMYSVFTLASEEFGRHWQRPEFRKAKVPGKAAFSNIVKGIQDEFRVTVTETRVIDEMSVADIPPAVRDIFQSFESYFRD